MITYEPPIVFLLMFLSFLLGILVAICYTHYKCFGLAQLFRYAPRSNSSNSSNRSNRSNVEPFLHSEGLRYVQQRNERENERRHDVRLTNSTVQEQAVEEPIHFPAVPKHVENLSPLQLAPSSMNI